MLTAGILAVALGTVSFLYAARLLHRTSPKRATSEPMPENVPRHVKVAYECECCVCGARRTYPSWEAMALQCWNCGMVWDSVMAVASPVEPAEKRGAA